MGLPAKKAKYQEQLIEKKEIIQAPSHGLKFKYKCNVCPQHSWWRKEQQDEPGLQWYDYGTRNYGLVLGRWMNIEPLAKKKTLDNNL